MAAWWLQEKKIVEEKMLKMGEREDSLPPEYQPTKEDLKVNTAAPNMMEVLLFGIFLTCSPLTFIVCSFKRK